jgi:threonine dehydrogenase-like Zn-dependent dehydrogenase
METAVNLVQDGAPILGEKVAVAGQGVVGLLTTALLAYFPLARLLTLDNLAIRQEASHNLGAHKSISSNEIPKADLGQYDLVFELSGNPAALDTAIALCRQNGRVVIGSWYGTKKALVDLGGRFHHARIQLISSQVSTIAPALSGRWDKARRFEIAWEMLRRIKPARLITARHDLSEVATVYEQLDRSPKEQIQSVFVYPN